MNLYDYLERNVNLDKISELNGDMYEMAELKYMINELSKLFYRNYTFFMFKEDLKNRTKIYERTIDPKNVEDFSVVCKSYCKLIKQLAKELYDITWWSKSIYQGQKKEVRFFHKYEDYTRIISSVDFVILILNNL